MQRRKIKDHETRRKEKKDVQICIYIVLRNHFFFLDTNRSGPYQYDNRSYEHDPSNRSTPSADEIISNRSSRRTQQSPEIEVGRTKLHRLLDQVLDKADSEEAYNPDSEIERQKRRRQRRHIHSI